MSTIRVCGESQVGGRTDNQDHYLIDRLVAQSGCWSLLLRTDEPRFRESGLICAVADGIGGGVGGADASRLALGTFAEADPAGRDPDGVWLDRLVIRAHENVRARAAEEPSLRGMGTTIVGVHLTQGLCTVFHAGDSRLYRFREGYLRQITVDHTPGGAEQVLQRDSVTRSSSVITNALGGQHTVCHPEIQTGVSFRVGDVLLLCSDGLTDAVKEVAVLENVLASRDSIEGGVHALIAAANAAGGPDNITVVLVAYETGV